MKVCVALTISAAVLTVLCTHVLDAKHSRRKSKFRRGGGFLGSSHGFHGLQGFGHGAHFGLGFPHSGSFGHVPHFRRSGIKRFRRRFGFPFNFGTSLFLNSFATQCTARGGVCQSFLSCRGVAHFACNTTAACCSTLPFIVKQVINPEKLLKKRKRKPYGHKKPNKHGEYGDKHHDGGYEESHHDDGYGRRRHHRDGYEHDEHHDDDEYEHEGHHSDEYEHDQHHDDDGYEHKGYHSNGYKHDHHHSDEYEHKEHHSNGYDQNQHHNNGYGQNQHHGNGYGQDQHHSNGYGQNQHHGNGYGQNQHHGNGYGQNQHHGNGYGQNQHHGNGYGQNQHTSSGYGQTQHDNQYIPGPPPNTGHLPNQNGGQITYANNGYGQQGTGYGQHQPVNNNYHGRNQHGSGYGQSHSGERHGANKQDNGESDVYIIALPKDLLKEQPRQHNQDDSASRPGSSGYQHSG